VLLNNHVCKEPGKAFGNGIEGRSIKQQLLLEGSNTLIEALRQTLGLEVIRLTVGSSMELWKMSDGAL
jgi:hypothetical protein